MAAITTEPIRLPPGPRIPRTVQGFGLLAVRRGVVSALHRRYGSVFTVALPLLGPTVVVGDPHLVRDLFNTSGELVGRPTYTFGEVIGPGSTWGLDGERFLERRRVLAPPFHGRRVRNFEYIIEEEVMREIVNWPQGREFATLPPMIRITLGGILRALFGAEGDALDELRAVLPPVVTLLSPIGLLPSAVRHDLGRWSPWGRFMEYRRRIDTVVDSLIADARADPAFAERSDVLAALLRARDDNGDPMPDRHIADELLTLMAAGHESTSATMAWVIERLRRHPSLLAQLIDEVDAGGSELRLATICEVQRTRPVVDSTLRGAKQRIRLGEWVVPEGCTLMPSIMLAHQKSFPDEDVFDPHRFMGDGPKPEVWAPFGGGIFRCLGSSFASMEVDVILRTLLRELWFEPTAAPGERAHNRGVVFAPSRGGRAVVYRRSAPVTHRTGRPVAARSRRH